MQSTCMEWQFKTIDLAESSSTPLHHGFSGRVVLDPGFFGPGFFRAGVFRTGVFRPFLFWTWGFSDT